jgi:transposase-like protein
MVVITLTCSDCHSADIVKNGHAPNAKQKYRCRACGPQSRDNPTPQVTPQARRQEILLAYQERSSLPGLERTFKVSRNTVTAWIKKVATLPPLNTTLLPAETWTPARPILELDELWSFVLGKADATWIWIAMCRHSRQVVAFVVGDRSEATCRRLWHAIPEGYRAAIC